MQKTNFVRRLAEFAGQQAKNERESCKKQDGWQLCNIKW